MDILSNLFALFIAFLQSFDNDLLVVPVILLCVSFLFSLCWRMVKGRYN